MNLPVVYREIAEEEYDDAAAFYNRRQAGLGRELVAEVEATLDMITANPKRYPVIHRDIREAPVQRFPYCVYYRVRSGRIIVLSVFHQSRDPKEWQTRN